MLSEKTILLKPLAATATTTGTGSAEVIVPPGYRGIVAYVDVTAASGTSPTLNVFIQDGIRAIGSATVAGDFCDGSTEFQDYIAFTQITTAADKIARKDFTGEEEAAATAGTLTAGQLRNGPMTGRIRAFWVVAGTNPSFTFSIRVVLIP